MRPAVEQHGRPPAAGVRSRADDHPHGVHRRDRPAGRHPGPARRLPRPPRDRHGFRLRADGRGDEHHGRADRLGLRDHHVGDGRQRPALRQPLPVPGHGRGGGRLQPAAAAASLLARQPEPGHRAAGRAGGGSAVPVGTAPGADPRHPRGAAGERGQEPLPGQHEPRVPHPAQRPGRRRRTAGHHPPGQRAARVPGHYPGIHPEPAVAGRGCAGHLRHRGRQAQAFRR